MPSRDNPTIGGGSTTVNGTFSRAARRRTIASASPEAPVTARSPRSMIAAFSRAMWRDRRSQPVHVVEIDVRDRGHSSVPGVGRVQPAAEPDLDERQVDAFLGEPAEDHRGEELELGRRTEPAGNAIGRGERLADEPGERGRVDRAPADLEALAVRHEVRLRRLAGAMAGRPERRSGQGQDTALAIRARDQGPPNRALRIAELTQECACPAKPEPDTEAAAIGERLERGRVLGLDRHSPVRSSS